MPAEGVAVTRGHTRERPFERPVGKRLHATAVVADEVMMMVAVRMRRLEARDAAAQVDPVDEAKVDEGLEHAVDARDPDPTTRGTEAVVQLLRRYTAVLAAEVLDHGAPGAAAAVTGADELRERVVDPGHA